MAMPIPPTATTDDTAINASSSSSLHGPLLVQGKPDTSILGSLVAGREARLGCSRRFDPPSACGNPT
jgi:hypothetical protein